jgi:hypothetical protein
MALDRDHVLIFGEQHLRQILYSPYYNKARTHMGLRKDAPLRRPVQRTGTIVATPILRFASSLRAVIFGKDTWRATLKSQDDARGSLER